MREIFRLHGLPKVLISNKYAKFTSKFWKGLSENMGKKLNLSTSYHPQTDSQMEKNQQVLEDMLRMYVKDKKTKWGDYLHLTKFGNKNGYQTYLKMRPFEVIYGRRCKLPLSWDHLEYKLILGPNMLKEM